jgi:hypothetical protein
MQDLNSERTSKEILAALGEWDWQCLPLGDEPVEDDAASNGSSLERSQHRTRGSMDSPRLQRRGRGPVNESSTSVAPRKFSGSSGGSSATQSEHTGQARRGARMRVENDAMPMAGNAVRGAVTPGKSATHPPPSAHVQRQPLPPAATPQAESPVTRARAHVSAPSIAQPSRPPPGSSQQPVRQQGRQQGSPPDRSSPLRQPTNGEDPAPAEERQLDPHDHPIGVPGPASALSIYILAHLYRMEILADLAMEHILIHLEPGNCVAML